MPGLDLPLGTEPVVQVAAMSPSTLEVELVGPTLDGFVEGVSGFGWLGGFGLLGGFSRHAAPRWDYGCPNMTGVRRRLNRPPDLQG